MPCNSTSSTVSKATFSGWFWAKADEEALLSEAAAAVDKAAETYLATPPQSAETIFDFTYETLPKDLAEQRRAALATERE